MTHTVKRLTAAGLVTRPGLESDGRAKHVELTDEGVRLVTACAQDLGKAVEELFQRPSVPVDDLADAQRLLVQVLTQAVSPGSV
jgi:DNA-binding MarR family transcriptional regulator